MHIFFLDDDPDRVLAFRNAVCDHNLIVATTAQEAIEIINDQTFDLLSLDHDLGGKVYCPSDALSGFALVEVILELPVNKLPKHVIIHTRNQCGAANMLIPLMEEPRIELYVARFGYPEYWKILDMLEVSSEDFANNQQPNRVRQYT